MAPFHKDKPLNKYVKIAAFAGAGVLAFLFVLIIIFNGQRIRGPLTAFIQEQTQLNIEFEDVEFSPLYPNTIKLKKVNYNKITVDEVYIEFDLLGVLFSNNLHIDDLYLNNIKYDEYYLNQVNLKMETYHELKIDKLRIEHSDLEIFGFDTKNTSLELDDITFKDGKLYPRAGKVTFNEVVTSPYYYETYALKYISFDFVIKGKESEIIELDNMTLRVLGGTLTTTGTLNIKENALSLDTVYASNISVRADTRLRPAVKIRANRIELTGVGMFRDTFTIAGIRGDIDELYYDGKEVQNGRFSGTVGEISSLSTGLGLLENKVTMNVDRQSARFEISSQFLDGTAYFRGYSDTANDQIRFDEIKFNNNKFELRRKVLDGLGDLDFLHNFEINSLEVNNMQLLSFIRQLPISAEAINVHSSALSFRDGVIYANKAAIINLQATNFLYADLVLKDALAIITITPDVINFSVPKLNFKTSSMSLALTLSQHNDQNFLMASARDFDMSNLNSNVFSHFFAGKISFDLELKSKGRTFSEDLQGSLNIKSRELLVSNFGLDLINGGDRKHHLLTFEQLHDALKQSDAGIYNLELNSVAKGNTVSLDSRFELASAQVRASLELNLDTMLPNGQVLFQSPAKDSQTVLRMKGKFPDVMVSVEPIRRGQRRAGLFDIPTPVPETSQPAQVEGANNNFSDSSNIVQN